jgi:hypothetical protein
MNIKKISNNANSYFKDIFALSSGHFKEGLQVFVNKFLNENDEWERSKIEPIIYRGKDKLSLDELLGYEKNVYAFVLYQNCFYEIFEDYTDDKIRLLVLEDADEERRMFEKLKLKYENSQIAQIEYQRVQIPEEVRIAVWRRDQGKCVKCSSREKLEYDHIIPVSKGGSNTVRNIELLCEKCNREKSNKIQ